MAFSEGGIILFDIPWEAEVEYVIVFVSSGDQPVTQREDGPFRRVREFPSYAYVRIWRVGAVLYFPNFVAPKPSRNARFSVERYS